MTQNFVSRFLITLLMGVAIVTAAAPALAAESSSSDTLSEQEDFSRAKAILNLNPGDEITIRANTTTTVTCAAGSSLPNCKSAIASYESRFQT